MTAPYQTLRELNADARRLSRMLPEFNPFDDSEPCPSVKVIEDQIQVIHRKIDSTVEVIKATRPALEWIEIVAERNDIFRDSHQPVSETFAELWPALSFEAWDPHLDYVPAAFLSSLTEGGNPWDEVIREWASATFGIQIQDREVA